MEENKTPPSYHDLHVTTADIPRKSVFDLPGNITVTCTRCGGWELWHRASIFDERELLAGEYDDRGLRLDVGGIVICDSLTKKGDVCPGAS